LKSTGETALVCNWEQRFELDAHNEYRGPNAIRDAIDSAEFHSRSHHAVIRVYDATGNVIETHERAGEFKEW
jgi:hypothetical protein